MNEIIPKEALKDHDFCEYHVIFGFEHFWPATKYCFKCKKCNIILLVDISSYDKEDINSDGKLAVEQNWYYDFEKNESTWQQCYEHQKYSCIELMIKDIIE